MRSAPNPLPADPSIWDWSPSTPQAPPLTPLPNHLLSTVQPCEATTSSVPATWLAQPTLRSARGAVKTAGVYYHQLQLRFVSKLLGDLVMAELRVETEGEYTGAVRVYVRGLRLGSIPHELSPAFREVVHELEMAGLSATCHASLEVDGAVEVWLYAKPERRDEQDAALPPVTGFRVDLHPGVAEELDAALKSKAKRKVGYRVGELQPVAALWHVALDGQDVGIVPLPPNDDAAGQAPRRRLEEARRAGFPLTCHVRIIREPERPLRVMVDLPQ